MTEKKLLSVVHGTVINVGECSIPTESGISLKGVRVVIQPDSPEDEPITEVYRESYLGFKMNQRVVRFNYVSYRKVTESERLMYAYREESCPEYVPVYTHQTYDEWEYLNGQIAKCRR